LNTETTRSATALWGWASGWTAVFAVNLIVPIMFGWNVTANAGRGGMFLAIGFLWAVGAIVSLRRNNLARSLIVGAGLFAFTQLFPIAQMFAGMIAVSVWQLISRRPDDRWSAGDDQIYSQLGSDLGGFVVTILVGIQLVVVAVTGGYAVRFLVRLVRGR
jgi:hypothetical protein